MKKHSHPLPPKWAERFLHWYCDESLLEDLAGDLHERFMARTQSMSVLRARFLYIWDVLVFLKPYTLRRNRKGVSFFLLSGNYFKSSCRSLLKNKLHTSLVISGLTVSMAVFILITMYVSDELKYDRHYDKADRIYKITSILHAETGDTPVVSTDGFIGQRLEEQYPEVEESVALVKLQGKTAVKYKDRIFSEENIYRAEQTYFNIFSHQWLAGNSSTALADPRSIVLSRKMARKYFGIDTPLDSVLTIRDEDYLVTGVIGDLPGHTDLKFDALISTDHPHLAESEFWCIVFILFRNEDDAVGFENKLQPLAEKYLSSQVEGTGMTISYFMESLPEVHFGKQKLFDTPKSSKSNLYIFSIVAFFILLIACINYANLSTVHAAKRNTEAVIRKVMGAVPSQLIKQYLFESLIVCGISFLLSAGLAVLLLGAFNRLTGKIIPYDQFLSFSFLGFLFLLIILIGVFAGSYPATLLASAKPETVLRGHSRIVKKNRIRNGLIVFQFTACIGLMISAKIVFNQLEVMIEADPGFNKEQVLVIDIPRDPALTQQLPSFKTELASLPFVQYSSLVGYNSLPTSSMDKDGYEVEFNGEDVMRIFNNISVDEDYIELLNIKLKEGRNFDASDRENRTGAVLVNETLVASMGWKNPLGQILFEGTDEYEVVGIVKDFHFNSFHQSIGPIVIHCNNGYSEKLLVKVSLADFQSMSMLEQTWKRNLGKIPFQTEFLDTYFNQQYTNEAIMKNVLTYFTVFIFFIAGLGLFGMVAISTLQKTKEFGIRKILGARFPQIAFLVVKEFIFLVLVAGFLAVPITWWAMNEWLSAFAYKTTLDVLDFILPVGLGVVLAIMAMAYHTVRASHVNPIESIRCN